VRLDAATTASTRLLFCTTGILLRRLASDAALARVSHVIVDEARARPARARARAPVSRVTTSPSVSKAALYAHGHAYSLLCYHSQAQEQHSLVTTLLYVCSHACACRRRLEQRSTAPGLRAGARAHAAGRLPDDAAARHRRESPRRWQPSEGAAQCLQGSSL